MRRFSCVIKETKNQILEEEMANYDASEIEVVSKPSTIPDNVTENQILGMFRPVSISPRLIDKNNIPPAAIEFVEKCLDLYETHKQWMDSNDPIAQKVKHGLSVLYQKTFIVR